MESMMSMMTDMLIGSASIALLVGGIEIMNMMLVSVTERTKDVYKRQDKEAELKGMSIACDAIILLASRYAQLAFPACYLHIIIYYLFR